MKIKYILKIISRRLKKLKNKKYFKNKILTRNSCLGRDISRLKFKEFRNSPTLNIQKGRVDMLIKWMNGETTPISKAVKNHLSRKDIYQHIKQQEKAIWKDVNNIEFLVMDSFSELTDQKFTHKKEGWSFLAHYSDINQTNNFKNTFQCDGLLPIEDFEKSYISFFDWFKKQYSNKNIYFIHFSTKFDTRNEFKKRASEILRILLKLEKKYNFLKNIYIPDKDITQNKNEKFPYHYSNETFKKFVINWSKYD